MAIVFPAISFFNFPVHASPALSAPIQVTSNPGEDFAPTVSADWKVMVYVSDKSGNLDLWLKSLGPGIQPPDQRLTFHSAEDGSPETSPDGKWVAFVSHWSDPRGDIYILDLTAKGGEARLPQPVIRESGEERDPVWSPDQTALYFSSRSSGTAQPVIEKIELEGGKRTQLLQPGGVNLSLSPDGKYIAFVTGESELKVYNLETASTQTLTQGPFIDVFPRWSVDGESILFTRYQNDTNHDGQLGIDDNPDIWSIKFNAGQLGRFRQLTDSSTYDFLPRPLDENYFLFTSHHKGNADVWKLPLAGTMPDLKGWEAEENRADDICVPEVASYSCVLALNNLRIPDKEGMARIQYRLAVQVLGLGHDEAARSIFNRILEEGDYR